MGAFLSWVQGNWSNAIGAAGIIGGLWFTGASSRQTARAKERENILALNQQHRELWSKAQESQELRRIFLTDIDLATPISVAEEEFLNVVLVHFETGWQFAREGAFLTLKALARDVRSFLSLPLPREVWEKTKQFRNPRFVRFVEQALGK